VICSKSAIGCTILFDILRRLCCISLRHRMDPVLGLEESISVGMSFVIQSNPGAIPDGSADPVQPLERLVLWKYSMSSLRLGARKDCIFICAAPALDIVFSESIYLSTRGDSWDFHRSQQPLFFICLYTLLVNFHHSFHFSTLHSFQPPPQGVQSHGAPFE
jgi:hypothetical protein